MAAGKRSFQIIPSIREIKHLDYALSLNLKCVLLSEVHIGNLAKLTDVCHQAGKKVIVNYELIGGLGSDKVAFQMLKNMYRVDTVIGVNPIKMNMIRSENLNSIQRISLIDSMSIDSGLKMIFDAKTDAIELRPGIYAIEYLSKFKDKYPGKFFAGGFVNTPELLQRAYHAGFDGVMTSSRELWNRNVC